jgi:IclR family mhp operon transcriptional activator
MPAERVTDRNGERGESIRSVERAIDVLQSLNRRPLSNLRDLHHDTGIPKPSIVRVLRTLEAKGLAAPGAGFGTYQLLSRVKSLASGFHHEPQIVEIAQERMIEFTRQEGWPLSLALLETDAMVVRACTIRFTALSLERAAIGRRLSLLTHAMGRAYLAWSAPNQRAILLTLLRDPQPGDPSLHDSPGDDPAALEALFTSIRQQGFALRDPLLNPRSATMAVPVFENGRILATLGFTWITAAMTVEQARQRYLAGLNQMSLAISQAQDAGRPSADNEWRSSPEILQPEREIEHAQ